jgi:hypothetical protein
MRLPLYVGLLHTAEQTLADSYRQVANGHAAEADVFHICQQLATQCDAHVDAVGRVADRYGEQKQSEPERLHADGLTETRDGPVGLLRDLQDLFMLASFVDITWSCVGQAAQGARDDELYRLVTSYQHETITQLAWLRTRMQQAAPQALLIDPAEYG